MTAAKREELIGLIESLPDTQVDHVLAEVRRLKGSSPTSTWPPKFVGMIKDGPEDGSSPQYVESALARGFGSERS